MSASQARSIVVLSQDGIPPDDADSRTARLILSLQQMKASVGHLSGHIVVELQDIDNLAMTNLVGRGDIEVIVSHELIGRLMLSAARSPWVAPVLSSLMGFEGSEFYLKEWPALAGTCFGAVHRRFDDAVPVGIQLADSGQVIINPADDVVIRPGDRLLVLAEDDDSYAPNEANGEPPAPSLTEGRRLATKEQVPERLLFCGWRRDMADMINELEADVPRGSELWLFNNVPMQVSMPFTQAGLIVLVKAGFLLCGFH